MIFVICFVCLFMSCSRLGSRTFIFFLFFSSPLSFFSLLRRVIIPHIILPHSISSYRIYPTFHIVSPQILPSDLPHHTSMSSPFISSSSPLFLHLILRPWLSFFLSSQHPPTFAFTCQWDSSRPLSGSLCATYIRYLLFISTYVFFGPCCSIWLRFLSSFLVVQMPTLESGQSNNILLTRDVLFFLFQRYLCETRLESYRFVEPFIVLSRLWYTSIRLFA